MNAREVELKLEITEQTYYELLNEAVHRRAKPKRYVNVYYDSYHHEFYWNKGSIRIRCREELKPEMTVKMFTRRDANGVRHMDEMTEIWHRRGIPWKIQLEELPTPVRMLMAAHKIPWLERVGFLPNIRTHFTLPGWEFPVDLDKTKMPDGTTFYEAELEWPDTDLLQRRAQEIPHLRVSPLSKYERLWKMRRA
jgi:uncharacterized protein YjbK